MCAIFRGHSKCVQDVIKMFVIFPGGGHKQEVTVPRSLVGVIIGKGGDMIKKITQDTGAKIQLKPGQFT